MPNKIQSNLKGRVFKKVKYNKRVNLTAGSSAALRGKVVGAVRLPVALGFPNTLLDVLPLVEGDIMRFIVPAIALLVLLSGCTSSSSAYKESFSEVHVSSDLKKILVIGTDKYSYEFDVPAPLSQMINSPLKKGLSFLFQNDGAIAFEVKKDGTILGSFSVVLPDSFFQDHESMKQVAESIGFSHGHIYSLKGRMQVVRDGMPIPRYVAWSDADAEKYTKKTGWCFFSPTIYSRPSIR